MFAIIKPLQNLVGDKSWARLKSTYILNSVASVFEAASIAAVVPLVSLATTSKTQPDSLWNISPLVIISALVLFYIFGLCLRTYSIYKTSTANMQEGYAFSARLFKLFLQQPYEWHLNHHSADLRAALHEDAQDLITFLLVPLGRAISQAFLLCSVSLVLLFVQPLATLALGTVLALIYALIFRQIRARLDADATAQIDANALRHRFSTEAFGANREVRLAKLEDSFANAFTNASHQLAHSSSWRSVYTELPKLVLETLLFLILIVSVFVLLSSPTPFVADIGPVLALFLTAGLKLFPMGHLVFANIAILRSGHAVLHKFTTTFSDLVEPVTPVDAPALKSELRLQNVSYSYAGAASAAIQNITFQAKLGDRVAIVGPSGSGKSTLINIIAGLIAPSTGAVLIDGTALSPLAARSWQMQLQYCPQSPVLFDQSIAKNIALSDTYDIADVAGAASLACLDEFLEIPADLSLTTSIGERGKKLSGGQVQRVSIARTFYKQVPIYILDEPTSSLDTATRQKIIAQIFEATETAILFIVTHDDDLARRCNISVNLAS